jgi:hypothetical protein
MISSPPGSAVAHAKPLFLYIPVARLILMSIVSFGLYEQYWIYKNWRYVKERDNLPINPFWRAVFGFFYCHSLLRRIHEDADMRSITMPSFSPNGLATGWVVLLIIARVVSRFPDIPASMVAAFIPSFLCLVPVQNYVNLVTERGNFGHEFHRWSWGQILCLVIGVVIWAGLLLGLVQDE